jgi:hypothetical protein
MTARLAALGAMTFAMPAAAFAALRHVLAAVHPTVAVAVLAAAGHHSMALMLTLRALMLRGRGHLVLAGLAGLMRLMVLVLGRRGLRSGRSGGENERHRGNKNLHEASPETFVGEKESRRQAKRGGGGSDSG